MLKKSEKSKKNIIFRFRNYFTTGLLVLAPTAISIWILVRVFYWFDNILGKWYTMLFEKLDLNKTHIPGLGAITLLILVTLIGFFARQIAGRKLFSYWDKLINRVPLLNRIYLAVRQLSDSFASSGAAIFKRPVMIEYPRRGAVSLFQLHQIQRPV